MKNNNPEFIIDFFEHLVGLLKPKEVPTNRDVELYLRNYDRLVYKMDYMVENAHLVSSAILKYHKDALAVLKPKFDAPNGDNEQATSLFMTWADQFCIHAAQAGGWEGDRLGLEGLKSQLVVLNMELDKTQKIFDEFGHEGADQNSPSKISNILNKIEREESVVLDTINKMSNATSEVYQGLQSVGAHDIAHWQQHYYAALVEGKKSRGASQYQR